MTRTKHPEMAMVERRELRLVEPLDDRQDRGIHEADVGIGVVDRTTPGSGGSPVLVTSSTAYAPDAMSSSSPTSAPA